MNNISQMSIEKLSLTYDISCTPRSSKEREKEKRKKYTA
jgi:hypothetical protein